VRVALIRQPSTTLATILAFLPELTVSDLRDCGPGILPDNLRHYLDVEMHRRLKGRTNRREPTAISGSQDPP
jgi:hypothetical protein